MKNKDLLNKIYTFFPFYTLHCDFSKRWQITEQCLADLGMLHRLKKCQRLASILC